MITIELVRLQNYFCIHKNGEYLCDITTEILEDMRSWVDECEWREHEWDEDGFDPWKLSDLEIVRGIENHFSGGLEEFVQTYIPA